VGLPVLVQVNGAVTINPVVPSSGSPSLSDVMQILVRASYNSSKNARVSVAATDGSPYVVPLEGIAKVRFAAFKFGGQAMKMKITTAAGTDQVVPTSDIFILHAPGGGDEVTAIKVVGTGTVEYVIAGDPS
jgi:hypothetical protein